MSRLSVNDNDLAPWRNYFERHEMERINEFASQNECDEGCHLSVSLSHLRSTFPDLYSEVKHNPILQLEQGETVLQQMVVDEGGQFEIALRFVNLPPSHKRKVSDIYAKDMQQLVECDVVVREVSQPTVWKKKSAFKCMSCGNMIFLRQEPFVRLDEPRHCSRCDSISNPGMSQEIVKIAKKDGINFTIFQHKPEADQYLNLKSGLLADISDYHHPLDEKSISRGFLLIGSTAQYRVLPGSMGRITALVKIDSIGSKNVANLILDIVGIEEIPAEVLASHFEEE